MKHKESVLTKMSIEDRQRLFKDVAQIVRDAQTAKVVAQKWGLNISHIFGLRHNLSQFGVKVPYKRTRKLASILTDSFIKELKVLAAK